MTDQHTTKAFDSDLHDLERMVAEMGGLAEKQVADSINALAKRDIALAQRVTAADVNIDTLQHEIEEKAVATIARRQPMAIDLRSCPPSVWRIWPDSRSGCGIRSQPSVRAPIRPTASSRSFCRAFARPATRAGWPPSSALAREAARATAGSR